MATMTTTRVTLELDPTVEPIQGRIGEEGGLSREFVGWLGLASALGEALKPAQAAPAARTASGEETP